ncbi:MAG TPA: hypothetical protein VIJ72_01885, partial [Rhizomicrobium sp.]
YRLRGYEGSPTGGSFHGPVSFWRRIVEAVLVVVRLIVPVALLLTMLAATYLYGDVKVSWASSLAQGARLTGGDLILPFAFLAIHLTNRRYGAGYAFAQLILAMLAAAAVIILDPANIDNWIQPVLTTRLVIAFASAFFFANLIAIAMFDASRGPRWWTAPLYGSISAFIIFSAIYYPAAFAGSGADWMKDAIIHFGVFMASAVLLLIPYWMMRGMMRPLSGLNGY